jgi:uncharacterized protein YhaN
MSKEIMQQALTVLKAWDALIKYQYGGSSEAMTAMQNVAWNTLDIIASLEAELAKPEQEPASWQDILHNITSRLQVLEQTAELDKLLVNLIKDQRAEIDKLRNQLAKPEQTWVGLSDEEFKFIASKYILNTPCGLGYFQEEIEAKLKEKNNAV